MTNRHPITVALSLLLAPLACAQDGVGALGLEIWGEDFIESGIPAAELADGWSVTFTRFLVNVGEIAVHDGDAAPALSAPDYRLYDLAACSGPEPITSVTAPAGLYDRTVYTIAPATAAATLGNAAEEDLPLMVDNGYSVYVEGAGTSGDETVTFRWGFTRRTAYGPCHSTAQLEADGAAAVQITIHGDHLFYDDAVSSEPALRFADVALADADGDGEVTAAELAAYDIRVLPKYGVGNLEIDDLWGFIDHMTTTLGHIDGEGHCGE